MEPRSTATPPAALADHAVRLERLLDKLLSPQALPDEIARPERLRAAMAHGLLGGGKRLRPFLVEQSAALFDVDGEAVLRVGAALECIHCYSLVHDDLPAMDDDDLRRGQPTVHRAFDEATAILAGDALLTLAFDIVTGPESRLQPDRKLAIIGGLSRAAGIGGMVGGQMLDLEAEKADRPLAMAEIETLQSMKTGALLRFACEAGAIAAGAPEKDQARLRRFGEIIGLSFQLADDLLDIMSDPETIGKATGKDATANKATLPSLRGVDWTRERLQDLVAEATELLRPFGSKADVLVHTARYIAFRDR
ncbi:polyprenyl synthetase family protein [Notoacmeibacter sp. MSK16QG-6]|uniref:polyprenyl synthetase family protein n=1 Tax=Notoacmeibacter sp. MSK16QG-6 TaxID=2957982 RepID=UPI00209CC58C|nr:farnesyl diphosphate synthase [Notoacmeibacter sp. MSK16QG-6]MCP1200197.1 polyprenyl synthetase family protein [Notoacmeibacter sp. MSK16QG-6]